LTISFHGVYFTIENDNHNEGETMITYKAGMNTSVFMYRLSSTNRWYNHMTFDNLVEAYRKAQKAYASGYVCDVVNVRTGKVIKKFG
jgi:hypothetical protein